MFFRVNILPENKMTTPNGLAFVRLNISTLVIVLLLQCQVRIVSLQLINYKHNILANIHLRLTLTIAFLKSIKDPSPCNFIC